MNEDLIIKIQRSLSSKELYKTVQDFWFYVFQQKLEHIPVKGITTT